MTQQMDRIDLSASSTMDELAEGLAGPVLAAPTVHVPAQRGADRRRPGAATVSVVVPAMNEEHNIGWVISRIPQYVAEILVVDGYSTDETAAVARAARDNVRVIQQRGTGKGAAMRTGFEAAVGDYVVVLDADGSMEPAEIDYYVAALEQGYDLVKGSRALPSSGSLDLTRIRRLGNQVLVRSVNVLWGSRFTDLCYGYLAFRRDCLDALALTSRGFEIETEIAIHAIKAGLRIAEVPSIELLRQHGVSNLSAWRDGRCILGVITRERTARAQRPVVDLIHRRALSHAAPRAVTAVADGH